MDPTMITLRMKELGRSSKLLSRLGIGQLIGTLKPILLWVLGACLVLEIFLLLVHPETLIFVKNSRHIFQSSPVWKVDYKPNTFAHFYLRSWSGVTIYDFSIAVNEYGLRDRSRQIDEKIISGHAKHHI